MITLSGGELTARFPSLVLSSGGVLPNAPRDRQLLWASAVLGLESGHAYSEAQINQHLLRWTEAFGAAFGLDAVALRRELVEAGFLVRDRAGRAYRLAPEPPCRVAAPPEGIDLRSLVDADLAARAVRKRRYTGA